MESKAKLFGHPIHPMLVVFPLAMFVTSVIFDIVYLATGSNSETLPVVSYYMIMAGLIGAVLAAIFGFRDFYALPRDTRAKRIGFWHGLGNVVLVLLFGFSFLIRNNAPDFAPPMLALVASFAGAALGAVTAWMGGELVYRLGVGVDEGANINAPNSLAARSTRPVSMESVPITGKQRVLSDEESPGEDELKE